LKGKNLIEKYGTGPGTNYSTNPLNEFTHKESASDIYGLLDLLNIDKFKAIGFSSGAML